MTDDDTVTAWRLDFLSLAGWVKAFRSSDAHGEPLGFYNRERAECLRASHAAPAKGCTCGVSAYGELTADVARVADALQRLRAALPTAEATALALSRVRVTRPSAVPPSLINRQGIRLNPPGTVRGAAVEYVRVFVDRDWPLDHVAVTDLLDVAKVDSIPALIRARA